MECPQCKNPLSVENASVCEWCGNQLPIPEESFFSMFGRWYSILKNYLKINKKRLIIFVSSAILIVGTLLFVFNYYSDTNDTSAELGQEIEPKSWEEKSAFDYLTDSVKNSKEDFEILARKYSQDTLLSSYQGRRVNNGQLPHEFDDMASKLEVNKVSEIFEIRDYNNTLIQYAIMKVLKKGNGFYEAQYITRNIKLEIFQYYQGGIIVELDYNAEHGLIAAKKDLDECNWYDAKKKCEELKLNGYDDWQLPNKDELDILYKSKDSVGGFAGGWSWYWSSTEGSNCNCACDQNFIDGNVGHNSLSSFSAVRAVRAF